MGVKKMMPNNLKKYKTRLNIIINELEILEDEEDYDYSDVISCLGQATRQLENRREVLQRKGRCL